MKPCMVRNSYSKLCALSCLFTRWLGWNIQVSELEMENERLGKENGALKLVLDGREDENFQPIAGNQFTGNEQLHDLQDKVKNPCTETCQFSIA